MTESQRYKQNKIIFASSCVESAARKLGISSSDMYQRMKKIDFIKNFIFKCYDALHTQSREHVTEDILFGKKNIVKNNYAKRLINVE